LEALKKFVEDKLPHAMSVHLTLNLQNPGTHQAMLQICDENGRIKSQKPLNNFRGLMFWILFKYAGDPDKVMQVFMSETSTMDYFSKYIQETAEKMQRKMIRTRA
jgi:hypothetical protein